MSDSFLLANNFELYNHSLKLDVGRRYTAPIKLVFAKRHAETEQTAGFLPSVIHMQSTLHLPPKLIDYLNETRAPLPPVTDPDQPLQIDSLGLIRLVAFLESDLNVIVEDEELLAENFATGRNLANLINPKIERLSGGAVPDAPSSSQLELGSGELQSLA